MRAMVEADLLKLTRRRGLWLTCLLLAPALVLLVAALAVAGVAEIDGGASFAHDLGGAIQTVGPVMAILVGARLGSDEQAAGTLRYQLLTGVPRHRLLLSKLAVLGIACLAIAIPAALACGLGGMLVGDGPRGVVNPGDVLDVLWAALLPCLSYGCVSFAMGVMLGSTGPAIAVGLVLNLVGLNLLSALVLIDDWFRHVLLDVGIDRLTDNTLDRADRIGIVGALIVVLAWPLAFLAAAWTRLRRLEA
jgi:ABC-type transport system involved in multi-copper enzyme maturation permease subunit